jgi:Leucine-rich repeat (LRR) protein
MIFSQFLLLLLFIICCGASGPKTLDCSFETMSEAEHQVCEVSNVNLSGNHSETFEFSGTPEEKTQTKALWFVWSPDDVPAEVEYTNEVDFVPPEIFQEFSSLNGLAIQYHKIPVLKNGLFTSEFRQLEFLYLGGTEIAEIESEAFKELVNLKWLKLWNNKIKAINLPIFKFNSKLIYVSFNSNQISKLNPTIFDGLSELKKIDFDMNECYSAELEAKRDSLTSCELDKPFSKCFENCRSDPDCSAELIETEKIPCQSTTNKTQAMKRKSYKLSDYRNEIDEKLKPVHEKIEALQNQFEQLSIDVTRVLSENFRLQEDFKGLKSTNEKLQKRFEIVEKILENMNKNED